MKHPQSRAERRKRSLATHRFRDHIHLNETKKERAGKIWRKLQEQSLLEQEFEDELEQHA